MFEYDELIEKELKRIDRRITTLEGKSDMYGCKYEGQIEALKKEKKVLKESAGSEKEVIKNKFIAEINKKVNGFELRDTIGKELIDFIRKI